MTTQIPARNYAVMSQELNEVQKQFQQGTITEEEYLAQKAKIEQDIFDYKYKKPFFVEFKHYLKEHNTNFWKKLLNSFATLFAVLALVFTVLPLERFGLAAAVLALVLGILSIFVSKQLKVWCYARYIVIIALLIALFATGKIIFSKDEVVDDNHFEQLQKQSEKEDIKELEGL